MLEQSKKSGIKLPAFPEGKSVGVALSGGGARGIAHAGALKAIEEAGIKPCIIAGVSAGSIAAVLYSAGVPPQRILDMFTMTKLSDFTELTWGKGGVIKIEKFINFITRALGQFKNLEDLRLPTYIGVTNFDTGRPEEFHAGEIGPIITASCSIPIAIPPVKINGYNYVDGGVLRNLPAWTIRDKCDLLIGINVSPINQVPPGEITSLFDIAMRTYTLLAKSNQELDMKMCDLVVRTQEISHLNVFSLKEAKKIFNSGYINTRKALRDAGWWKPDITKAAESSAEKDQPAK